MNERTVIIGGGQAGAQCAISLRQAKYSGEILILGAEQALPYQRPPLSKSYLIGEMQEERLYLRRQDFYDAQNITLRTGLHVEELDRSNARVKTSDGDVVAYDKLLLATGAPPRKLNVPGAHLPQVHYLRTLTDSDALRRILEIEGRIVIVGAGYIGLEVAAVARKAGRDVTVLEMADRVLSRVASEPVSDFFTKLHEQAGVIIRRNEQLEEILGGEAVSSVRLASGETIDCAAVLVGIGSVTETALAEKSGLPVDNGVVVDEHACTSDPAIWAAGDCTNFPLPRYRRRVRLESVPNAIEQAKAAAKNMAGEETIYDPVPWFWSDQFDVKLQTAGLSAGADQTVLRGDPTSKKLAVWYLKEGCVLAVDAINDPMSFNVAKNLIAANTAIDPDVLADPSSDLKTLMR